MADAPETPPAKPLAQIVAGPETPLRFFELNRETPTRTLISADIVAEMIKAAVLAERAALALALPTIRAVLFDLLWSYTINGTLSDADRKDLLAQCAHEVAAINAATACIGPVEDFEHVDTAWLDAVLKGSDA